jgi:hypothetical protein
MPSTHFPATPIFDELQIEWEEGWRPSYPAEHDEPAPEGVERDG